MTSRHPNNFVSRFQERSKKTGSILCVGIDPTEKHVPPNINLGSPCNDIAHYIRIVIDIATRKVPVVKFQFAYFARLGSEGVRTLRDLISYARSKGLLVILDGKRVDIGATMEAYGEELFDYYRADAATIGSLYFGMTFWPTWKKWFEDGRMSISMIRTSNPEGKEIQELPLLGGTKLYQHFAELTGSWHNTVFNETNGLGSVGGVVGATFPEDASKCRELAGDKTFLLVPGYGAQGGGAEGAVAGLVNSRREIMGVVNSSRGITLNSWFDGKTGQPRPGDPFELVEDAIDSANAELNAALQSVHGVSLSANQSASTT